MTMRATSMYIKQCLMTACFAGNLVFCVKAQVKEIINNHSFKAGAGSHTLSDDIVSVFSEKLSTTALQYSFTSNDAWHKKSIVAGFEYGAGTTSKGQLRSDEFTLRYIHAFSVIKNKHRRWNNYTGYSIVINPQYSKKGDQYSWATSGSLSLYNSLSFSWKKNAVDFDVSIPLAGFGSRPDSSSIYKGTATGVLYNSFSNLSFTSWHNSKAVSISLFYKTAVSRRLYFSAGTVYSYRNIQLNSSFTMSGFSLRAGVIYEAW